MRIRELTAAACLAGTVGMPLPVAAQSLQAWVPTTLETGIGERWNATLEIQPRFDEDLSDFEVFVVRPALSHRTTEWLTMAVGANWNARDGMRTAERRLWQQGTVSWARGRWSLAQRTRLEQRWIADAPGPSLRLRGQVRGTYRLATRSPWRLAGSHEVLWTLNDQGPSLGSGLHSTRTTVGVGRAVGSLWVEPGYMLMRAERPGGRTSTFHVLMFSTTFRF